MERRRRTRLLKVALPLALLALGVCIVLLLLLLREEPVPSEPAPRVAAVEVERARVETVQVVVHAHGTVTPARRAALRPSIAGPIIWVADAVAPGAVVEKGQLLVRVDPREYRYAIEAREGRAAQAALELRAEENRREVAEVGWDLYDPPDSRALPLDPLLALRELQVESAREVYESAIGELRNARLALSRTWVRAPFRATVESEEVDEGDRASPEAVLLTLVGVEHFRVRVSIPPADLPFVRVPGRKRAVGGSRVLVRDRMGPKVIERTGEVVQLLSEVEPDTAMVRLLVRVHDPLGLEDPDEHGEPLLLGTFVDVRIQGQRLSGVVPVPRRALRNGDQVWIATEDDRLAIREVEVVRRGQERVLIGEGVRGGERIVTSDLELPLPGLRLRVRERGERATADPSGTHGTGGRVP